MSITTPKSGGDILEKIQEAIQESFQNAIADIYVKHLEAAHKEAEEKKNELVMKTALNLEHWYELEYQHNALRIIFKNQDNPQ